MPENVFVGTTAAALKGDLLTRATVEKLAESTTLDELVNRLKGTPYAACLSRVTPPYTARGLELAFRERLADAHYLLMSLAKEPSLISLYYLRQIAWDLKTVLKSRALGRGSEESMEYLTMHAEELVGRRDLVVKVVSAKDLQEAAALLSGTEFGKDIASAVNAFSIKREIRLFDIYIDHAVLSRIASEYSSNSKMYSTSRAIDIAGVSSMVALDINSYNVLSVLRAKVWRLPEDEVRNLVVTPPRGTRSPDLQSLMVADAAADVTKALRGCLPQSLQLGGSEEDVIDAVEAYFTAETVGTARKSFVWQGLGLSTALALVKLHEFEVKNLAAISIGIEAGVEAKNVLSRLVF